MSAAPVSTNKPALATVPGVELFAAGTFDGKTFAEADVAKLADNYALLSTGANPLHRVPVVLGHEEDQEWLTRTDLPAAGWVGPRVWADAGGKLFGDFAEVPPAVADAINSGAFKKVSAEIYDDFVDNAGNRYGPALRRVALLGAEIPKVKGLADLPAARFSDNLPAHRAARVLKFAEGKPVASESGKGGGGLADAVKKMLKDAGLSDKTIGMLDGNEDLMASLLADLQGGGEAAAADANNPQAAAMSEAAKKAEADAARKFSEIAARQDALDAKVRDREQEEERRTVYLFCESLKNEKRIPPAELDETDPRCLSLPQRLLAMDDTKIVKFSEGGKDTLLSPRQLEMERLRRLPVMQRFAEKTPAAAGAGNKYDAIRKAVREEAEARRAGRGPTLEERLGMVAARGNR